MDKPPLTSFAFALLSLTTAAAGCSMLPGLPGMGKHAAAPSSASNASNASSASSASSASTASSDSSAPAEPTRRDAPEAREHVEPAPWVGPLEQKYNGKIVFSSKPIAMKDTDDSSVYQTYKLGEPLYIRYFGKDAPQNLSHCGHSHGNASSGYRTVIRADVNGEYAGKPPSSIDSIGGYEVSDPKVRGANSLTNELNVPVTSATKAATDDDDGGNEVVAKWNSGVVTKLKDGDNTIRILISLDCGSSEESDPIIAEGTLNVKVAPGAKSGYLAKLGPKLAPSPHPENAKLVPQIINIMKHQSDWANEDIVGARVTSADWEPIRNEYGRLVAKQVNAVIVVHAKKEPDKQVCRLFTMSFDRDIAGGALRYSGTGDSSPFACANAPR